MIGQSIAHFEITAKIGEGGMGEVYQATDKKLNRKVALKVLPQSFAQDPQRMGRFQREAQALASLNHPGIASIYGLEEANGTKALVMELVEGEDLSERIARGPIPLDEALPIALQIAEALEDAHEKGIIHRDLKPANIKLTSAGRVKILDFGLAKALEEERTQAEISNSPTLTMQATQAGTILGTATYMSPEQARGKSVDKRADIWAFGIVLFEMLAGEKALVGEDLSLTLASVMKEEPDWGKLSPETPFTIRRLLKRSLRKDVHQRLRDIGDARIVIQDYLEHPEEQEPGQITTPATRTSKRNKVLLSLVVLLSILLGVLLSWALRPEPSEPSPVRLETQISGDRGFNNYWGNCAALSPDGQLLVYDPGGGAEPLHLRPLDSLTSEVLPSTEHAFAPFFSPDGRWVAYSDRNAKALQKVSLSGGTPVTICSTLESELVSGTWGSNGVIVFSRDNRGLMRVPAAGGTPEVLTGLGDGEFRHAWPEFLPGGKQVLFTVYGSDGRRIEAVDIDSRIRTVVLDKAGEYPRYAASGHLLSVDSGTIFAASFDSDRMQIMSESVPVVEDVMMDSQASGAAQYGVSGEGTLFYLTREASGRNQLMWVDADGRQTSASTTSRNYTAFPDLSPDGRRLAVGIASKDNVDIWVIDLERDAPMRLTFDEAEDNNPVWSPDGSYLYFESFRNGNPAILRKAADGSGEAERVLESDTAITVRHASDKYLALAKNLDLYLFSLQNEGSPEPFLVNPNYEEGSPRFSPTGNWLAYDSNETGRYEVYMTSFPEPRGRWQVSTEGGFRPKWSADGTKLYYRTDDAIWVSEIESHNDTIQVSEPARLVELEDWQIMSVQSQDLGVDSQRNRFLLIGNLNQSENRNQLTFVFNWFEELKRLVPTE